MERFEAFLDEMDIVTILLPKESTLYNSELCLYSSENEKIEMKLIEEKVLPTFTKFYYKASKELELGISYIVTNQNGFQTDLIIGSVVRTEKFDQIYYYEGKDLGSNYSQEHTVFKVWAPTATNVNLNIYNEKGRLIEASPMTRKRQGVWAYVIERDVEGIYYRYNVCVNKVWREATDPYSKGISVNSAYSVVIDLEKCKVMRESKNLPKLQSPTDAIIYETHIRDFSAHPESGMLHIGKYKAFTERNTKGPNNCLTGVDYLIELGITHIELLPFNDFGGVDETNNHDEYNWGYNPIHYNVPEGSYATNPYDPYVRIREAKEMIEALHRVGIRVIMDVVFNHVYIYDESVFRKIVPGYYFRYNEVGLPSNGTGVGNDIASERLMVRKFIIDSTQYWIEEYNIDGFRFDLMGILDIETMKAVRKATDRLDPTILILGEGWNLDTPLPENQKAIIKNAADLPRIAFFNDEFRDTIKGGTFNLNDKGFISGNTVKKSKLRELFAGSISLFEQSNGMFDSPIQTINYIECHDNFTVWDTLSIGNDAETMETRRKRQSLGIAMTLFSLGIPFLHSGMEFYRTKYGEGNSYNLPDRINQIDWARKNMYEDHVSFVKNLILIRKAHPAFRLATAKQIRFHYRWLQTPSGVAGFVLEHLKEIDSWEKIMVFFNSNSTQATVPLIKNEIWNIAVDGENASLEAIGQLTECLIIKPLSTVVLFK